MTVQIKTHVDRKTVGPRLSRGKQLVQAPVSPASRRLSQSRKQQRLEAKELRSTIIIRIRFHLQLSENIALGSILLISSRYFWGTIQPSPAHMSHDLLRASMSAPPGRRCSVQL